MKDIAQFLKVLADEARLQLLWLLHHHGELCVCDLMAALGITQSKASRHLATLRHAGLVSDRRAGAWSYYSLRPAASAVERAVLETLWEQLAAHPGAASAEQALRAWLDRKPGEAQGLAGMRCASPTAPRSADRTPTPPAGAGR